MLILTLDLIDVTLSLSHCAQSIVSRLYNCDRYSVDPRELDSFSLSVTIEISLDILRLLETLLPAELSVIELAFGRLTSHKSAW